MLKELTKQYIQAFSNKDLEAVSNLLSDEFILQDPVVKCVVGKENCLKAIQNIFESCKILTFRAKNIYQDNEITLIEFELKMDNKTFEGVDIIAWHNGKIRNLRAYLDTQGIE